MASGWDVDRQISLWHITPTSFDSPLGSCALSPDKRELIVYCVKKDLRLFSIRAAVPSQQRPKRTFAFDVAPRSGHSLQIGFLRHGEAVACGTTTGSISVWLTRSGEPFQHLPHDHAIIQALAVCQRSNLSFIAAGSADQGRETCISVWRAKTNARAKEQDALSDVVVAIDRFADSRRFFVPDHVKRVLILTVAVLCIVICIGFIYCIWLFLPWANSLDLTCRLISFTFVKVLDCLLLVTHQLVYLTKVMISSVGYLVSCVREGIRKRLRDFILEHGSSG